MVYNKAWHEANKEKVRGYGRAHYAKNREKVCAYQKAYREANKEKVSARQKTWSANLSAERKARIKERRRKLSIKRRYGLAPERYEDVLSAQNGLCAICASPGPLVVDHCHTTGRVRGLLCTLCNVGIGALLDSEANLLSAVAYLKRCSAHSRR